MRFGRSPVQVDGGTVAALGGEATGSNAFAQSLAILRAQPLFRVVVLADARAQIAEPFLETVTRRVRLLLEAVLDDLNFDFQLVLGVRVFFDVVADLTNRSHGYSS